MGFGTRDHRLTRMFDGGMHAVDFAQRAFKMPAAEDWKDWAAGESAQVVHW